MILKEAEEMARKGTKITRPAWNGDFFLYTDGKLLRGRYIGETCFTDMRAYAFSDEDRKACDWAAIRVRCQTTGKDARYSFLRQNSCAAGERTNLRPSG